MLEEPDRNMAFERRAFAFAGVVVLEGRENSQIP